MPRLELDTKLAPFVEYVSDKIGEEVSVSDILAMAPERLPGHAEGVGVFVQRGDWAFFFKSDKVEARSLVAVAPRFLLSSFNVWDQGMCMASEVFKSYWIIDWVRYAKDTGYVTPKTFSLIEPGQPIISGLPRLSLIGRAVEVKDERFVVTVLLPDGRVVEADKIISELRGTTRRPKGVRRLWSPVLDSRMEGFSRVWQQGIDGETTSVKATRSKVPVSKRRTREVPVWRSGGGCAMHTRLLWAQIDSVGWAEVKGGILPAGFSRRHVNTLSSGCAEAQEEYAKGLQPCRNWLRSDVVAVATEAAKFIAGKDAFSYWFNYEQKNGYRASWRWAVEFEKMVDIISLIDAEWKVPYIEYDPMYEKNKRKAESRDALDNAANRQWEEEKRINELDEAEQVKREEKERREKERIRYENPDEFYEEGQWHNGEWFPL